MRSVLVQKFGGTSVSTAERRQMVVDHVRRARGGGHDVAIVVSAIGRRGDPYATDTLLDLLRSDGVPVKPADYTLMFVTGEMISVALMSHTLNRAGIPACGLSGAQARIFTDGHPTEAEVVDIDVSRMRRHFDRGEVPVITGGQGIERDSLDYNTLGRGASDTSGVVVGVALGATQVEIFTDVEGIATADPRVVPEATIMRRVSFERMHELARYGAKVIHARAVKAGWVARTPVVVRSTFSSAAGTVIGDGGDESPFSGVASLASLTTVSVPAGSIDASTLATWERRRLIMHLEDQRSGDLVLGCPQREELLAALDEAGIAPSGSAAPLSWVSVIGDTTLLAERLSADGALLSAEGAAPRHVEARPFRSTCLVEPAAEQKAVRVLHGAYISAAAQTP